MNQYFAIISKQRGYKISDIWPDADERIRRLVRENMFDYVEPTCSCQYSESGHSALYLFSLRGESLADVSDGTEFRKYAITNSGYPRTKENLRGLLENNGCDKKCISEQRGIFSICVLDKINDEIRAYNNHMRLENIYYAENEEFYFLSTRALLLAALISEDGKPKLDMEGFNAFLHFGYYACEGTAFEGVTEVPIYSEVKMTKEGFSFSPIEDLKDQYFSKTLADDVYDEFAQTLLDATEHIKPMAHKAKIGLTGGKDSRMMVLALNKVGGEFSTETTGYADHSDVIVAKRIAEMLGVEHNVYYNATYKDNYMEQDILGRTQRVLFAGDCSIWGYEGCGGNPVPYKADGAVFNGLGGEILRGGYAKTVGLPLKKSVPQYIEGLYNKNAAYFHPELEAAYTKNYYKWIEGMDPNKLESLDWLYVQEHMGKWASATMKCRGAYRQYIMPLCDEQLIKKTLLLKTEEKMDNLLIFEIIRRLDDRFTNVPLADVRWTFEENGPRPGDEEGYRMRTPVVAKSKQGSFAWRMQTLSDMRENMASVIFDNRCSKIFDYLDKEKVEKLFCEDNQEFHNINALASFAWRIYSGAVLLEGSWYSEHLGKAGGFEGNSKALEKAKIAMP